MSVVCDSTTLIDLGRINQLHLLEQMFQLVYIPPEVHEEVVIQGAGKVGSEEVKNADFIHQSELRNSQTATPYIANLGQTDASVFQERYWKKKFCPVVIGLYSGSETRIPDCLGYCGEPGIVSVAGPEPVGDVTHRQT